MIHDSPEGGCVIVRPRPIAVTRTSVVWLSLLEDLHIGARDVEYSKIAAELEEAKRLDARILIGGDVIDAILPKDHKRYDPGALHQQIAGRADVLNASVDMAVEILGPYADRIDMIGCGNHETAVSKYHGLDVTAMLIDRLRAVGGEHIQYGGYSGFVDYRFRRSKHAGYRYVIWYHHGSGGSAPVTKGMIDFARKQWATADLKWLGHKHSRFSMHEVRLECPKDGDAPHLHDVRCVMTGSYFRTYHGQTQASIREHGRRYSYASDAGLAPQGMGGARVRLEIQRDDVAAQIVQ